MQCCRKQVALLHGLGPCVRTTAQKTRRAHIRLLHLCRYAAGSWWLLIYSETAHHCPQQCSWLVQSSCSLLSLPASASMFQLERYQVLDLVQPLSMPLWSSWLLAAVTGTSIALRISCFLGSLSKMLCQFGTDLVGRHHPTACLPSPYTIPSRFCLCPNISLAFVHNCHSS